MSKDERFLLIKAFGCGFWADMDDLQSKLLLAEITNRQPVVFWGENSFYSVGNNLNSFEQYFKPVSNYSIADIVNDRFTYYPPVWNASNVLQEDGNKRARINRDIPSYVNCEANVLVSDVHNFMVEFIPWLKEDHPVYGLGKDFESFRTYPVLLPHERDEVNRLQIKTVDMHRYIVRKYIKLQAEISDEIDQFYNTHMKGGPILAAHVRSDSEKCGDVPTMNEINQKYFPEIEKYLNRNPSARIFLLTANEKVLEQYQRLYGNMLIYTDCTRDNVNPIHYRVFPERKRKAIEIIKDTYLACKCDHFIGTEHSNVSVAITRLKVWGDDSVKLLK